MSTLNVDSINDAAGTGAVDFPNGLTDNGSAISGAPIGNIRASESTDKTLTAADDYWQVFDISADITVTLPTTDIDAGKILVIESWNDFTLDFKSFDDTAILRNNTTPANTANAVDPTIHGGKVVLRATQAAPTTPAHWEVVDVYERFTTDATSGTSAFTTGNWIWIRKNTELSVEMDRPFAQTSQVAPGQTAGAPVRFRPTATEGTVFGGAFVQTSGAQCIGFATSGSLSSYLFDSSFAHTAMTDTNGIMPPAVTYLMD